MTDWISVKERLPKKKGRYLVYAPHWDGMEEMIMQIVPHRDNKYIKNKSTITHWMPLPDPPEGADND